MSSSTDVCPQVIMDEAFAKSEEQKSQTRDLRILDPDGDITLCLKERENGITTAFQVSSKILRLASPVFTGMLKPTFEEGHSLRQGGCAVIELAEDSASLMGLILAVLHFRGSSENHVMDAEKLARLAIHCDKYDLANALGPWISVWFKNLEKRFEASDAFGHMLLAAYLFNDFETFEEVSASACKYLPPGFSLVWEKEDLLTLLPVSISDAMTIRIKSQLDRLEMQLEAGEFSLRQSTRHFETSRLMCTRCGRTLPMEAKKCHPCRNSDLTPRYCSSETRIAEYFEILRKVELWPTTKPFGSVSVSDIVLRFACAKTDLIHSCTGGSHCPLLINLDKLSIQAIQSKEGIKGICLRCIREDHDWDGNEKCAHR